MKKHLPILIVIAALIFALFAYTISTKDSVEDETSTSIEYTTGVSSVGSGLLGYSDETGNIVDPLSLNSGNNNASEEEIKNEEETKDEKILATDKFFEKQAIKETGRFYPEGEMPAGCEEWIHYEVPDIGFSFDYPACLGESLNNNLLSCGNYAVDGSGNYAVDGNGNYAVVNLEQCWLALSIGPISIRFASTGYIREGGGESTPPLQGNKKCTGTNSEFKRIGGGGDVGLQLISQDFQICTNNSRYPLIGGVIGIFDNYSGTGLYLSADDYRKLPDERKEPSTSHSSFIMALDKLAIALDKLVKKLETGNYPPEGMKQKHMIDTFIASLKIVDL